MTVARHIVLLVFILPCYVESGKGCMFTSLSQRSVVTSYGILFSRTAPGSFWLTTQPPSVLQCNPRGRVRSHVRLECAVTGPEGSMLRIRWYHWRDDNQLRAVTSSSDEFGGHEKQLIKSKQRTIGAEGRFSSTLRLSGAGLFGCYACQVDSTKPQHSTAASNVLCFGNGDNKRLPPCKVTLLVDSDHAVQLKQSSHAEEAGSLPAQSAPLARSLLHSSLRRDVREFNNSNTIPSGGQDQPTAIYAGIGVGFVISVLLLIVTMISGVVCWRRQARRKVSTHNTTGKNNNAKTVLICERNTRDARMHCYDFKN